MNSPAESTRTKAVLAQSVGRVREAPPHEDAAKRKLREKKETPVLYLLLYIFWIILNGKPTAEMLITGVVLTALICALIYALFGYTPKKDLAILKKLPLFIIYLLVLVCEIIKASFSMLPYIFHTKKTVSPVLVTFRPKLKTRLGRFILANSITLTPGTITVQADRDVFIVHCLSENALDVSPDSPFLRWIRKLEA